MTNIIKGLRYQFTTAQLREHMLQRAVYHEERAVNKEGALPELQKAVDIVKSAGKTQATAIAQMGKFSNYHFNASDQIDQLETDIKDHHNKALVFRTLSTHLWDHATYDLDENDLRRLEIVK
jgi:hypothetical protein